MEIEIIIPENWHDVTLTQYLEFQKAVKPFEGHEEFIHKIIDHAVFKLCGVSADILHRLPAETFLTIQKAVIELIGSNKNEVLIKTFEIGDTTYGFIPDFNNMTYGEYIDLVELSKETWANIAEMMAVLYRPITKRSGDTYEIRPYNGSNPDQIELFESKLTMDIVYGALSFFLRLQQDLAKGILTYSIMKVKSLTPTQKRLINQLLTENGLSIQQFQSSLTTTLQSLTP
jgi:hypothetical protein